MKINSRMSIITGVLCMILGLAENQLNAFPWQAVRNVRAGVSALGLSSLGCILAIAAVTGNAKITVKSSTQTQKVMFQNGVETMRSVNHAINSKSYAGRTVSGLAALIAVASFYGTYRYGRYLYDHWNEWGQ